jgi:hypothetical protein
MRPSGPAFAAAEVAAAVEEEVVVVGAMGRYYIPSRLPSFVPSLSLLPSPFSFSLSLTARNYRSLRPARLLSSLSSLPLFFVEVAPLRYNPACPIKRNNNNARWCLIFLIFIFYSVERNQPRSERLNRMGIFFKRSLFNFGSMCS